MLLSLIGKEYYEKILKKHEKEGRKTYILTLKKEVASKLEEILNKYNYSYQLTIKNNGKSKEYFFKINKPTQLYEVDLPIPSKSFPFVLRIESEKLEKNEKIFKKLRNMYKESFGSYYEH